MRAMSLDRHSGADERANSATNHGRRVGRTVDLRPNRPGPDIELCAVRPRSVLHL